MGPPRDPSESLSKQRTDPPVGAEKLPGRGFKIDPATGVVTTPISGNPNDTLDGYVKDLDRVPPLGTLRDFFDKPVNWLKQSRAKLLPPRRDHRHPEVL